MLRLYTYYRSLLRKLVLVFSIGAGLGIVTMMVVTCMDVALRVLDRPLTGVFDIVTIAGALTIACALPYTTAVKGHVAIEFFFLKLARRGRTIVDTLTRLITMNLFVILSWHSTRYGLALRTAHQVTPTLRIPVFWVPWVIALSCGLVALVILDNLLHPGKEFIKP